MTEAYSALLLPGIVRVAVVKECQEVGCVIGIASISRLLPPVARLARAAVLEHGPQIGHGVSVVARGRLLPPDAGLARVAVFGQGA